MQKVEGKIGKKGRDGEKMSQRDKLLVKILLGTSDANIPFEPLCQLLHTLGFEERIRGSHHIFSQEGIEEILNLQPKQGKAKAYQVKQVRDIILKYQLGGQDAD
jgi:predicted RNA binding protein YcfA (HicA-like mRNA interferase family)